jgi:cobalamin biosynthesis Co2+ chelatase CbiK
MTNVPIVLTAFGTMSKLARDTYSKFELDVRKHFPNHKIIWAYTAASLVVQLRQQGESARTLKEAYTILRINGFHSAIVQSLHLVPGCKHHTIINENTQGLKVIFGTSLLETKNDISEVASEVLTRLLPNQHTMVIAHGNANKNQYNTELESLGKIMSKVNPKLYFTCLETMSRDTDQLISFKDAAQTAESVYIYPMFLVHGSHVDYDILGNHKDSIKSYLAVKNFVCTKVLGEQQWVRDRFLNNISKAIHQMETV